MKQRKYNGSDAYMLESASLVNTMLGTDLADFTAFDTTINSAFRSNFDALIEQGIVTPSDGTIIDQQTQHTVQVINFIKAAKDKYAEVRYFINKAFPSNPEIRNELGQNDYDKARRNQAQMIIFLDLVFQTCQKYSTQLNAAGMTNDKINEINNLRFTLQNANINQELFMLNRPTITRDRITLLNAIFENLSLVIDAAHIVYRDNEAKRNAYSYTPNNSGAYDNNTSPSIEIPAGSTLSIGTYIYDNARVFQVENTGTVVLVFSLSNDGIAMEGNQITVDAGQIYTIATSMLHDSGNFLMCYNANTTVMGYCEVTTG